MERRGGSGTRDYWARRAFGSRVIFDLSCVSIATVMDLMVYAACSPVRRRPASDLITFGNKSIPEMPVHGHDPQSIPEVWVQHGVIAVISLPDVHRHSHRRASARQQLTCQPVQLAERIPEWIKANDSHDVLLE